MVDAGRQEWYAEVEEELGREGKLWWRGARLDWDSGDANSADVVRELPLCDGPRPLVVPLERINHVSENGRLLVAVVVRGPVEDARPGVREYPRGDDGDGGHECGLRVDYPSESLEAHDCGKSPPHGDNCPAKRVEQRDGRADIVRRGMAGY